MHASVEQLLDLLDVRHESFTMSDVETGTALSCPGQEGLAVHFVVRGEGTIECGQARLPLRAGTILLVPPRLTKTIRCARGQPSGLVVGCASVTASLGKGNGPFDGLRQPFAADASELKLGPLFETLVAELSRAALGSRAIAGTLMKHLMIVLLREQFDRNGAESSLFMGLSDSRLSKAISAIVSRPGAPYCVNSLARLAGMSRSSFARHFTAAYGRSPMEFVHSMRMRAAGQMLRGSELPIKSIAVSVGYESRSHFSRAFRAAYGLHPTRYRAVADTAHTAEIPQSLSATIGCSAVPRRNNEGADRFASETREASI